MNDQQSDLEERQQELERIYEKIVKRNMRTYDYEWFTDEQLALIRFEFGIKENHAKIRTDFRTGGSTSESAT